ncbi:MAG: hypothetical protein PUE12_07760 [Oscillospiraceae bacterium]|nr:hypothetical protein [Oscillospiraceae bacterium]
MGPVSKSGLREGILEKFDKAADEAIKAGITADELKKRLDEVISDDKYK